MAVVALPGLVRPPSLGRASRSLVMAGLGLLLVTSLVGAGYLVVRTRPVELPLHADTVALGAGGQVIEARAADVVPGSRVLAGTPDTERLLAEEQAWLAAGTIPAAQGVSRDMVVAGLLDLRVLSRAHGVPVAGWSPAWRHVWPRDSALAAAALARTGHLADAERVVTFLQRVQPASGVLAARYLANGRGEPDARGTQLDGVGWSLWATAQVAAALPVGERADFVRRHAALLDRSANAARAAIDNPRALPPVSPDYWEVPERRPTLSTAALLAAGLESAAALYAMVGDEGAGATASDAAARLRAVVLERFGPDGFPRHLGGRADSVDLGVSFLLPPFAVAADPVVVDAWRQARPAMARPAGGLAPGGSWRRDGISWTNATATYALTAAAVGERSSAQAWLGWLDRHRTPAGSFPEKVLADGRPASVAPLAWTAAAVVLTADVLGA
jgi:GH15 family glucan-1,4-alpha-glucosidase